MSRPRRTNVEPTSLFAVPERRMTPFRPGLEELLRPDFLSTLRVEIVRPADLVHLTFSFVNLTLTAGSPPSLTRRAVNRGAFLIVDLHSQHIVERALFEGSDNYPVKTPPPPLGLPNGAPPPPSDPDAGKGASATETATPPVFASLSGPSRLVFKVTKETIPFTSEGLLAAMSRLDLSVAPQALPPQARHRYTLADALAGDKLQIESALAAARAGAAGGESDVAHLAAELTAIGRMRATAAELEYRFGAAAATGAVESTAIAKRVGVARAVGHLIDEVLRPRLPPLPSPPAATQTSLELPWRLLISPTALAAFAHSVQAIEHAGRVELWHTRLGVRARDVAGKPILDAEGNPTVDERPPESPTIRALWARDFDILPAARGRPEWAFTSPPAAGNFPTASGDDDVPPVRTSLNSRDRMSLVHETSNFHLKRNQRQAWTPEAVPTNRLMLTALGGWLDSRVEFPTLPDGGLTIEEWKHRAALGRDHQVKVVYAGFLLPFGHKASLVKITERKFPDGKGEAPAFLFQRMFIIVREPDKQFRQDTRSIAGVGRLDLVMPFGSVRILTRVTPPLDKPQSLAASGGFLFEPHVLNAPFLFKLTAVDLENNIVEFAAPLVFMERDHNDPAGGLADALNAYNESALVDREFDLHGQKVAFAESTQSDDTTLATQSVMFNVVTAGFLGPPAVPQDEPRFVPVLDEAKAVVPAMSALAGAATAERLGYPPHFAEHGFTNNAAEVFLKALDPPRLNFSGQGDRSGGFVTPSLDVKGLSRLTGPIGGDLEKAIGDPGNFDVGEFFDGAGLSAKLFGLIPLKELFGALGFSPDRVPTFVAQALDVASTLKQNVERLRNAAAAEAAQLGAAATKLQTDADALFTALGALAADPANPPNLEALLKTVADDLSPLIAAVEAADALPQAQRQQLVAIAQRVRDQLENAAAVTAAAQALVTFARGLKLPEVVHARLDWSTDLDPWPTSGDGAIFAPVDPKGRLTLAVEVQAPTTPGKQPTALVTCSLSPFDLRLIGSVTFIVLKFRTFEFTILPGKKPDVNVKFADPDGIVFDGPLEFVNRLKDVIPFNGFSDPPYLDVSAEGVKAGFDLAIPDLAVGVFALTNVSLGAQLHVPFVDESIETRFNFSTRENPFRLQVSLFAGGGFFAITITPDRVRVLEAALEFGAAISVNLGVASGSVSIMAGIYFRLETGADGHDNAQLTGYFRMRGEVDVLGLISASIELYLELTYETATGKAVGRATITVEVEICFLSFSVSISCEKKFAGSGGDPSFADVMGLPSGAPAGAKRPWDVYCRAFVDE